MASIFPFDTNKPFSLTVSNGFYQISQPTNNNLVFNIPSSEALSYSHETSPVLFYLSNENDKICLDYTKCTNLGPFATRKQFIDAVNLLPPPPAVVGNVFVTNFPANQNVTVTNPVTINDPVVVDQGTNPWTVDGTVAISNFPAVQPVSGTVTANQGTSPWITSVGNFPAVQPVNDNGSSLTVDGTVAVTQSTSPWITSVSNFPAVQPVNDNGGSLTVDGSVSVTQGTSPWVTSVSNFPASQSVTQGTSPWVTSVSNFPAVQPVSGTVTANQGTSPWVSSVSNFPAVQPVNDNGGSLTVDGTIAVTQSTSPWVVNESQIGGSSYTLGQKTMANSAPVVIASDQSAIPVSGTLTSNPSIPVSTDLVGASRTTTGTLVTIPAGRTFLGSVSLSCSITIAGNSQPTISTSGAGVLPLGTLHQIVAAGLALSTATNSNTIGNVYIYGGAAGATVTFTQGAAGTSTGQICGRLM